MKDQPKTEKPKTEQELAKLFVEEYQALCQKYGFQIVVTPAWKVSQDTGTWSTVLQSSIGKLPNEAK